MSFTPDTAVPFWIIVLPLAGAVVMAWKPVGEVIHAFFAELLGSTGYDTENNDAR